MGATASMAGHCCSICSPSVGVSVGRLPEPKLTPLLAAAPGKMIRLLAPMLAIVFWMAVFEPWPMPVMAMTAATPMITPSAVSAERILFRRKAPKAVRQVGGRSEGRLSRWGTFSVSL